MKPSYKDEYGEGVTMPINAMLFELTQSKKVLPANNEAERQLFAKVRQGCKKYRDTEHFSDDTIWKGIFAWLFSLRCEGEFWGMK